MDEKESDPSPNKVVLIGSEGVGKTSIFLRFKNGHFSQTTRTQTTYDAEHYKEWIVKGHTVKMTLFDTVGMERFSNSLPPTYFRNAKVILLVYSIVSADSMSDMPDWIQNFSITRLGDAISDVIPVLVGNKSDMAASRDVPVSRARETATLCGIPEENMFEISAKTGEGFDELFNRLAILIDNSGDERLNERGITIRPTSENSSTQKKNQSCPAAACNK